MLSATSWTRILQRFLAVRGRELQAHRRNFEGTGTACKRSERIDCSRMRFSTTVAPCSSVEATTTRVSLCPAIAQTGRIASLSRRMHGSRICRQCWRTSSQLPAKGMRRGVKLHRDQRSESRKRPRWVMTGVKKFRQRKQGQGKSKGASVRQLAFHPDLSPVKLDQFFRDVESQAQPLAAVVDRIGVLVQAFKNQVP